jgi:dTDP-4-dehydrorhamnose 3,5-epimerase
VSLTVHRTGLEGVLLLEPSVHRDERGFFLETYNQRDYQAAGVEQVFVQDNHSRSRRGVLRGFHLQDASAPMAKLVRCVRGRVLDAVVDLRAGSPSFGRHLSLELDEERPLQVLVPVGFGHAFLALSEWADLEYRCDNFYAPAAERVVAWDDPEIGVDWPVKEPVLSPRDRRGVSLRQYLAAPAFRYEAAVP